MRVTTDPDDGSTHASGEEVVYATVKINVSGVLYGEPDGTIGVRCVEMDIDDMESLLAAAVEALIAKGNA